MRRVFIFLHKIRYRLACRALKRPFDQEASLRLDRALVALERALGAS